MENRRRLEASIKGAQSRSLHTGSPPIMNDIGTSVAEFANIEEVYIKREIKEEQFDTEMTSSEDQLLRVEVFDAGGSTIQLAKESSTGSIMNLCFMCTKDNNCVPVDGRILSQVDYLLPEITIIKLGVPLRICSACNGSLCAFSKFKQSSVESSRRLEASIKRAQSRSLHTGSPSIMNDIDTSDIKPEKIEIYIKEEKIEETSLDIDNTLLQNHKEVMSTDVQLSMDTDSDSFEVIVVKEEEEQDKEHTDRPAVVDDNEISDIKHEKIEIYIKEENKEEASLDLDKTLLQNHKEVMSTNVELSMDTNSDNFEVIVVKEENKEASLDLDNTLLQNEVMSTNVEQSIDINSDNVEVIVGKEEKDNILEECATTSSATDPIKEIENLSKKPEFEYQTFQCSICHKSFRLSSTLYLHMKTHALIKDFSCDICGKMFSLRSQLHVHKKVHYGFQNFACSICNKLFREDTKVKRHMKIHLKEFRCETCNRIFVSRDYLKKHITTHEECKK